MHRKGLEEPLKDKDVSFSSVILFSFESNCTQNQTP